MKEKYPSENPNDDQTMNAQIVRHVHLLLSKRSRTLTFLCCVVNNLGLWMRAFFTISFLWASAREPTSSVPSTQSPKRERWGLPRYGLMPVC